MDGTQGRVQEAAGLRGALDSCTLPVAERPQAGQNVGTVGDLRQGTHGVGVSSNAIEEGSAGAEAGRRS